MVPILINWRDRVDAVQTELDKAIEFIEYLDKNYSTFLSEEEGFKEWRGKYGRDHYKKVCSLQEYD